MFGHNGPLGTFSAKIRVCFSFGYLSREMFSDLEKVRKLRNQAAHATDDIDFLDPGVSEIVTSLTHADEFKNNFKRFSPTKEVPASEERKAVSEAKITILGYVKYSKSVFCLAIHAMCAALIDLQNKAILPARDLTSH